MGDEKGGLDVCVLNEAEGGGVDSGAGSPDGGSDSGCGLGGGGRGSSGGGCAIMSRGGGVGFRHESIWTIPPRRPSPSPSLTAATPLSPCAPYPSSLSLCEKPHLKTRLHRNDML
jgi:hypothetical protein